MKKLFIVIIFLLFIFSVKSYSLNSDSYRVRSLYFSNLSTNNIIDYFSDKVVIRMYPRINPIYKERIGDVSYKVQGDSLSSELDLFRDKYLSFIKKNSYLDYNYLYMNGISIDRLDVYISDDDLNNLVNSDLVFYVK